MADQVRITLACPSDAVALAQTTAPVRTKGTITPEISPVDPTGTHKISKRTHCVEIDSARRRSRAFLPQ
jgi:hypothetical protein